MNFIKLWKLFYEQKYQVTEFSFWILNFLVLHHYEQLCCFNLWIHAVRNNCKTNKNRADNGMKKDSRVSNPKN